MTSTACVNWRVLLSVRHSWNRPQSLISASISTVHIIFRNKAALLYLFLFSIGSFEGKSNYNEYILCNEHLSCIWARLFTWHFSMCAKISAQGHLCIETGTGMCAQQLGDEPATLFFTTDCQCRKWVPHLCVWLIHDPSGVAHLLG